LNKTNELEKKIIKNLIFFYKLTDKNRNMRHTSLIASLSTIRSPLPRTLSPSNLATMGQNFIREATNSPENKRVKTARDIGRSKRIL